LNTYRFLHTHTPSAVGVLIGHMLFTDFSIYPYLSFLYEKCAQMAIYCAKSFMPSLNKKGPRLGDRGSLSGVIAGYASVSNSGHTAATVRRENITVCYLSGSS
jgi:hypothetical protein